ncbi:MAG TPA: hypothetical protein VKV32_09280 [Stellaceae bacterium]|nr:hypothetical protein [Stellaceae bacterium]
MRGLLRVLLVGAIALGLGGCVAYPAGYPYYYGGYGYYPYYYGPPAGVYIGGGWGWHHHDWR